MSGADVRRTSDDVTTAPPESASHEDKPDSPTDLHKRSWGYVLRKTLHEFSEDQCTDLAAALTYYAVLAVFPAMIALVSTIGVFADPAAAVDNVLQILRPLVSSQILGTIEPFLTSVAQSDAAGVGLVVGLLAALWSASGYVGAFSRAMNKIYEIEEGRPFWKLRPVMLLLTFVSVVLAATVLVLLVVSGPILQSIGNVVGLGDAAVTTFAIVKWPLVLVMVVVLVGLLYYVTPNIQQPKFKWISVGAAAAIGIWVLASVAFALYLATFANYSKTYGAAASVIVALLFVWITNVALLFGAELDSELERGRQLQAGMPAEEDLQLPPRDTRNIKKLRKQRDKDAAIGRRIRREASQRDDASAATDAPHREQKEGTP